MSRRFESRKACVLDASDLSPKGSVDAAIAPHVDWLNSTSPDVCTTSSCSGRVTLFAHAGGGVTKGGRWLHTSHEPAVATDVETALADTVASWSAPAAGDVVLRFEPFILTCACATLDAARTVMRSALAAGLRESGLVSWPSSQADGRDAGAGCVVTVRGSLRLEVPVVTGGQRIVDAQALAAFVGLANTKFEANAAKARRFFDSLRDALTDRSPHGAPGGEQGKNRKQCNSCGQVGHLAAACPLRAQRTRVTVDATPDTSSSPTTSARHDGEQPGMHVKDPAAIATCCPIERTRFAVLIQTYETIADLCAGAGDMVLASLLTHSSSPAVQAFEWRPDELQRLRAAVAALPSHAVARVAIVELDLRVDTDGALSALGVKPHSAHRVLVPDASAQWLSAALRVVRLNHGGGVLHVTVPFEGQDDHICDAVRAAAPAAGLSSDLAISARVIGAGGAHTLPYTQQALMTVDIAVELYRTSTLQMVATHTQALSTVACPHHAAFTTNALRAPHVTAAGSPFSMEPLHLVDLACIHRAVAKWTPEYVAATGGAVATSCHVSTDTRGFDLAGHKAKAQGGIPTTAPPRNFSFIQVPFNEAIRRCCDAHTLQPLVGPGELVYIRTVGSSPRAHVPDVLPALAADLDITCACDAPAGCTSGAALVSARQYHSSCLRISGPGTRLFCHYDTVDNVLMQITGQKLVVLFPPSQMDNLYLSGSSCRVPPNILLSACGAHVDSDGTATSMQDALHTLAQAWPRALHALPHARKLHLVPGSGVFIPALWLHCIATPTACSFSAGLNVFFRARDEAHYGDLYDPSDAYGNKDPHKVASLCADVSKAAKTMSRLPQPWRGATARKCAGMMLALEEPD